jgi:hypothetical protein
MIAAVAIPNDSERPIEEPGVGQFKGGFPIRSPITGRPCRSPRCSLADVDKLWPWLNRFKNTARCQSTG